MIHAVDRSFESSRSALIARDAIDKPWTVAIDIARVVASVSNGRNLQSPYSTFTERALITYVKCYSCGMSQDASLTLA